MAKYMMTTETVELSFSMRKYIIPYDKNGLTHGIERIVGGPRSIKKNQILSDQTFCRDIEHGIYMKFIYETKRNINK